MTGGLLDGTTRLSRDGEPVQIPRLERRVLGSIYGSSRPERDFALTLDLYRRGRLLDLGTAA